MITQEQLDDIKRNHMRCNDCIPMDDLVEAAQTYLDLIDSPDAKATETGHLVAAGQIAEQNGDIEEAELLYSQARAMWVK